MNFFDSLGQLFHAGLSGAMVLLPIAIGLAVIVIGIRQRFLERRGHKIRTTATCVGVEWKRPAFNSHGDRRPTACPRLRVNLNGREYELFNRAFSSSSTGIREGMEVPIRINPDDPDDYYIDELLTPARVCLLIGLVLIALGVVAWFKLFN